ncbi:hypothetical protein GVY41_11045 [Frigidibacter albus]|uniref:DUF1849 family protein n=1 Tax=Frigidibacter albus TaxID=1465486 RepID=A0A6L8VGV2_9RHOB|nr:hypothetical protein [Frigidibacter albus]MZQ89628.1 hypothetical protein [Frigidibacter albus]NBE31534.1 hypothetical protein [Frigidibacter albus]GGH54980.1 hypothetical protein GCM10011341_22020 [Frigidibacter albus]
MARKWTASRTTLTAAVAGLMLCGPAAAATFTPPQGCTPSMTVQMRGCLVAHYFTCEGDAPGDQWDTLYDADGPFFSAKVDSEFQWIESWEFSPPQRTVLEEPSRDAASFSGLLETGEDTYDFSTLSEDGYRRSYVGVDRLTGESAVIDGIELEVTEFEIEEKTDTGEVVARRWGNQYVHRDWRLFFSGRETFENPEGRLPTDNTPVDFIFPGEPGYLSTVPLFGCDELMSQTAPALEMDHG